MNGNRLDQRRPENRKERKRRVFNLSLTRREDKAPRPDPKKHCRVCEKTTTFRYNKNIGHSECEKCGCRFGVKPEDKERRREEHFT